MKSIMFPKIAHTKYLDFKLQKNEFAKVTKIFSGTRKKMAGRARTKVRKYFAPFSSL